MRKTLSTTAKRSTKQSRLSSAQIRALQKRIYDYYHKHGRDLPWRKTRNPYRILVSEIMLQQTQVERVLAKYKEFLAAFPDFPSLAKAPLAQLLRIWSGLGYNRRALALKALAQQVVAEHKSKLPADHEKLLGLPGIGKYTAGALLAFAFNKPVVFMDTNIRRVYIHHFFHDQEKITDDELAPFIEQTLDTSDPRKWHNALMDYGSMLRQKQVNPNRKSAHYTKQNPFENSNRQVRGMILKILVQETFLTEARLVKKTGMDPARVKKNIVCLSKEGFIKKTGRLFTI